MLRVFIHTCSTGQCAGSVLLRDGGDIAEWCHPSVTLFFKDRSPWQIEHCPLSGLRWGLICSLVTALVEGEAGGASERRCMNDLRSRRQDLWIQRTWGPSVWVTGDCQGKINAWNKAKMPLERKRIIHPPGKGSEIMDFNYSKKTSVRNYENLSQPKILKHGVGCPREAVKSSHQSLFFFFFWGQIREVPVRISFSTVKLSSKQGICIVTSQIPFQAGVLWFY